MRVHKIKYYNISHDYVKQTYPGNPIFVNEFTCVRKLGWPHAVYHNVNSDRLTEQKEFLLVRLDPEDIKKGELNLLSTDMSKKEMEKERFQRGVLCKKCQAVIYSVFQWDMHACSCMALWVDGGKELFTRGAYEPEDRKHLEDVVIDLLTDKIMPKDFKSEHIKPTKYGRAELESEEKTESGIFIPTSNEIEELGYAIDRDEDEIFEAD